MNQKLISLFKETAASGELPKLIERHSTLNVRFPTLGGQIFWTTHFANGWKLQINDLFGNWRILDDKNNRVAWGKNESQLENLLNDRPTSLMANFLDEGDCFGKIAATGHTDSTVILIHGWGVRASSMQELAESLAQRGFDAYNYDYKSSKRRLREHCSCFLERYRELLGKLPQDEKIHFLTHSMGGLILRGAMAEMREEECHRIKAIVMLGPPNRGSGWASLGGKLLSPVSASLQDMALDAESFVNNIKPPAWLPPVGIIAGLHDGKVAIENTRLPEPLSYKHTIALCTHPGLRNPANVLKQVLDFYSTLSFDKTRSFMDALLGPLMNYSTSPFYLCKCTSCDFIKSYEIGNPDLVISLDDNKEAENFETVKSFPEVCPVCGSPLEKKHLPDIRKR